VPKSPNYKNKFLSIFGVLFSSIVGVFIVLFLVQFYLALTDQM